MDKLPEDFKQKWLAALRSGNFKQGRITLHDRRDDTFCCLGVGCIVAGVPVEDLNEFFIKPVEKFSSVPELIVGKGFIPMTLSNMNDSGESFNEIAVWIEKNL